MRALKGGEGASPLRKEFCQKAVYHVSLIVARIGAHSPHSRRRIPRHLLGLPAVRHEPHPVDSHARLRDVRRQDHLARSQRRGVEHLHHNPIKKEKETPHTFVVTPRVHGAVASVLKGQWQSCGAASWCGHAAARPTGFTGKGGSGGGAPPLPSPPLPSPPRPSLRCTSGGPNLVLLLDGQAGV